MTTHDMWLVYKDSYGKRHLQHWKDLPDVGTLVDEKTGDDMALVGWTVRYDI